MKYHFVYTILLCSLFSTGVSTVFGAEDETDNFEGRVGLGIIFINSGNNLNPSGSKKYISDLNSAADKESSILPIILPSVTYTVKNSGGLKFYFDTEPPIDEAGGFGINFGGSYPTKIGIVDTSLFFTPFEEAWKNPYATGVNRETTSTSKYGVKIALNRIMGTGLRVNTVFMNDDVTDDLIGEIMPEMGRDGSVYALNANYSFYISETLEVRPRISVRKGEYDGSSNSFTKYKVDLEARYKSDRLMIIPRIFYSSSEYDEMNPIFDKTRKDDGYGANVMINYMAPFGLRDWSVLGLIGFSKGDSNITFYDTESLSIGAGISYSF